MDAGRSHCTDQQIEQFLDEQLGPADQMAFEEHLEECAACQQALMAHAARPQEWQEARDWLQAAVAGCDANGLSPAAGSDAGRSGNEVRAGIEAVLRSLAPTDDPRMLGRMGPFEVQGVIGSGGMGVVLKGFDPALNRTVAIKVLAPHLAMSGSTRRRFAREAQAAAAVVHENVVAIHSVAEAGALPYFVMPYIRGASLERRVHERGPLRVTEILRIAWQAAAGLAAAHAQGLVHRDVKPANILLEDGVERLMLTDFGLARAVDDASLTRTGVIAGTPQYMSPEQARGETIDARSDLFSLGSVMYAMCTGRPPFRAETSYGILRRITDSEPRPIHEINPEIPDWLVAVVAKLHAKDPAKRFASAAEVATVLRQCLAHLEQPHLVGLPPQVTSRGSPTSQHSRRRLLMSIVVVSFLSGSIGLLMLCRDPQSAAPPGTTASEQAGTQAVERAPGQTSGASAPATGTQRTGGGQKFRSAEEAYRVGVAFYNSKNYEAARAPLEAALQMTGDNELRLKIYEALLPAYRAIPEFEPFQTASEFIITHSQRHAQRSLTRRAFLSFAFNRGQMDNLIKRYEGRLAEDRNDKTAIYLLSEIYSATHKNPRRAIELMEQLAKLEAAQQKPADGQKTTAEDLVMSAKMAREKGYLARQYVEAKQYRKAAETYEEIAPLDPTTRAWNLKEAAAAWLKDGNKEQALRLALKADQGPPEARNDQLAHFFHRNLADVLMAVGRADLAVRHYRVALEKTNIETYVRDTKASLQQAQEAASKMK